MKKIIIPFDGGHFSEGAFKLASILNETNPVLLTGVFLPEVDFAKIFFFPTAFAAPVYIPGAEEFEEKTIERNIKVFKELCQKNNIKYNIHKDLYDTSIAMLTKESRFADLMIIGSEVFYTNGSGGPLLLGRGCTRDRTEFVRWRSLGQWLLTRRGPSPGRNRADRFAEGA